jgi:hypothetical protein
VAFDEEAQRVAECLRDQRASAAIMSVVCACHFELTFAGVIKHEAAAALQCQAGTRGPCSLRGGQAPLRQALARTHQQDADWYNEFVAVPAASLLRSWTQAQARDFPALLFKDGICGSTVTTQSPLAP